MLVELEQIINELKSDIKKIKDLENLKQVKAKFLSKSIFYNKLKESIKTSDNKREIGEWIKKYTTSVNEILSSKKDELENSFFMKKRENPINDFSRIKISFKNGSIHPITILTRQVMEFFDKLNYHYAHGIELEEEKFNFDILNLDKNHPAREMQDTFYLRGGKLLRTHATNMSARELFNSKHDKYRSYSIGPVFRNDDNDATHSFQFNQIDIFNNGIDMNISNLKWTLNELMKFLFKKNLDVRYRPSYFPFTEPSYEVDVQCPHCENKCKICSYTSWIEILGSGMLSPIVFKNAGINPEIMQGWAAGIGVERIAMIKWMITDIRDLYNNDLDFLKSFKKENK
ncbi:MAG: phenylalanine--tRNA ligase subunit alpha [Mycoplasmataceae bacterium]|nr:phenylalanine--tRNA ligase subunit alpha [Mycoplasmataceae bacterium]